MENSQTTPSTPVPELVDLHATLAESSLVKLIRAGHCSPDILTRPREFIRLPDLDELLGLRAA